MTQTEKGALTEGVYYILLSLYRPMHGYGIMQNIRELSGGRLQMGAGTLYGALNTLLSRGYIRALGGALDARKKEYEITAPGRAAVAAELARLEELLTNGKRNEGRNG